MGRWDGKHTPAAQAGLSEDDVFSLIRVVYPDADRGLISTTEITVYLFFDEEGRLLRHWVDTFIFEF